MLIDYDLFDSIQSTFILIALSIAALLLAAALWKKRWWWAVGSVLALVLAVAAIPLPDSLTTPVFEVVQNDAQILARRSVLVASHRYHFGNGADVVLQGKPEPGRLVVNNTKLPLVIVGVTYSIGGGHASPEEALKTIEAFSVSATDLWIEYYGNGDHRPPRTVQGYANGETRYWLTWK